MPWVAGFDEVTETEVPWVAGFDEVTETEVPWVAGFDEVTETEVPWVAGFDEVTETEVPWVAGFDEVTETEVPWVANIWSDIGLLLREVPRRGAGGGPASGEARRSGGLVIVVGTVWTTIPRTGVRVGERGGALLVEPCLAGRLGTALGVVGAAACGDGSGAALGELNACVPADAVVLDEWEISIAIGKPTPAASTSGTAKRSQRKRCGRRRLCRSMQGQSL